MNEHASEVSLLEAIFVSVAMQSSSLLVLHRYHLKTPSLRHVNENSKPFHLQQVMSTGIRRAFSVLISLLNVGI